MPSDAAGSSMAATQYVEPALQATCGTVYESSRAKSDQVAAGSAALRMQSYDSMRPASGKQGTESRTRAVADATDGEAGGPPPAAALSDRGRRCQSTVEQVAAVDIPLHKPGMNEDRTNVGSIRHEAMGAYIAPCAPALGLVVAAAPHHGQTDERIVSDRLEAGYGHMSPLTPPLPCEAASVNLGPPLADTGPAIPEVGVNANRDVSNSAEGTRVAPLVPPPGLAYMAVRMAEASGSHECVESNRPVGGLSADGDPHSLHPPMERSDAASGSITHACLGNPRKRRDRRAPHRLMWDGVRVRVGEKEDQRLFHVWHSNPSRPSSLHM